MIALAHVHHHQLLDLWLLSHCLLTYLHAAVLALLGDYLELVNGLLRDVREELVHAVVSLDDVAEELLCMRPRLGACASGNIVFYLLPVLAKHLKGF